MRGTRRDERERETEVDHPVNIKTSQTRQNLRKMCVQSVSLHASDRKLVRTINLMKYLTVAYQLAAVGQHVSDRTRNCAIARLRRCLCGRRWAHSDSLLTLLRPLTFPSGPRKNPAVCCARPRL